MPAPRFEPVRVRAIRRRLLTWYRAGRREFPWRQTADPYAIWVSEIMLQQTRTQTVVPYYTRFLAALPTVAALAAASTEQVLKLWEGLGYYTRARNLHRAAQHLLAAGGRLPDSYEGWRDLPGVGDYTAAAIASIALNQPRAAVDGNIRRVLARVALVREPVGAPATRARIAALARALLPPNAPGDFNQALMDLGATTCTPRAPHCASCPIRSACRAFEAGAADRLPQRAARLAPRRMDAVAAVIARRGARLLLRRPPRGLLGGLWELPGCEVSSADDEAQQAEALRTAVYAKTGLKARACKPLGAIVHALTHRTLHLHLFAVEVVAAKLRRGTPARWVGRGELAKLPLARLEQKALALAIGQLSPKLPARRRVGFAPGRSGGGEYATALTARPIEPPNPD